MEPPGYWGPNSDLIHGQGSNPRADSTSCIGQKVMLWERDAEPRKWKFEVSFSPVSLLFFFSPGSLRLFLLIKVLWAVLFLSLYNFCVCFVSIPLSSVIPPLSSTPSLLVLSLCSSFTPTCGFSMELWPPSSVPLWSLHDPPLIRLLPLVSLLRFFFSLSFLISLL